jgi:hypothetical protein
MKLKVVSVSTDSEINNDNLSELNKTTTAKLLFSFAVVVLLSFSSSY